MKILHKHRPHVLCAYTIKPNIYGSIAAKFLHIPVINNISGLGTTFIKNSWITQVVQVLYKFALRSSFCIFFQNSDDRDLFYQRSILNHTSRKKNTPFVQLLPGSGVDLKYFHPRFNFARDSLEIRQSTFFTFLFIGRILKDKGIIEYIHAARLVKSLYPDVKFCILGFIDTENISAITHNEVDTWIKEGLVEYLGGAKDVRDHLHASDCVVLPSYREGTPRTLLEAAAMAKPIITTDVPGCRDVVSDGENGFICKPYDSIDLSHKMIKIIKLHPLLQKRMGSKGREKVEREFDEKIVISKYIDIIKKLYKK